MIRSDRKIKPERFLDEEIDNPPAEMITDYAVAVDRSRPLGQRIRAFFSGQNKAGRIAGSILDAATILLPFGRQIQTGREAASLVLQRKQQPPMKKALSIALGTERGSLLRVRDENGKFDRDAAIASSIRLLIIIGVLYIAKLAGVLGPVLTLLGL